MSDNYQQPEDILSDESFLAWYFQTGDRTAWEHWMAAHPDRRELVQEAISLLDTTRLPEKPVPALQLDKAASALLRQIALTESGLIIPPGNSTGSDTGTAHPGRRPVLSLYKDRRWIAAACILVLVTSGLLVTRTLRSRRPEVKTAYGQIGRQQLPDGTDVTLNANSQLSYAPGWTDGADREVWIRGEAFFQVARTPGKSRFIVHTDHFDIIVTGTQFNVVNRAGKDNILLREGHVILHSPDSKDLDLVPGDFVEFHNTRLEKRPAKNDSLLAWKEHRLLFDHTPLRELVAIINEQYGVSVTLDNPSVGDSTITAILPNNNLDVLLKSLEATSEFDVIRQDNGITIRAHTGNKDN